MTETAAPQPRFWKRQFSAEVGEGQREFDILVGTLAPVLCLLFDPIVFKSWSNSYIHDPGLYSGYRYLAYISITIGILVLFAHWFVEPLKTNRAWSLAVSGILLYGTVFATAIGILLLPFSVLGLLLAVIGIFGFVPFFTAFVYLRNGVRAFRRAREIARNPRELIAGMAVGIIAVFGLPALIQWILWQNGVR